MGVTKQHFDFLKKLSKNNNRDWFAENKDTYNSCNNELKAFFGELTESLQKSDNIENYKIYRIYRDVRFSKNKDPYKKHFSGYFKRATEHLRGGYYLHLEPGNCFVAGGFWAPSKEDLLRIRKEFEQDDKPIRKILKSKKFKDTFGALEGDALKTAPRGFDPEHPAIDLIRFKQHIVLKSFKDKEVLSDGFKKEVIKTFEAMRPYFDYMSEVLTTDLNGISLLD